MSQRSIHIRRALLGDAAAFARVMGHPDVVPGTLQLPYASEALWHARLSDMLALGKPDLLLVAELPDGRGNPQVVATAGLHPCGAALRRRHAMNLGMAVHPDAQRQGVGHALMGALCHWADHWGQVLRIELSVFVDNAHAIRLYERHGFVHEGRHRGYALRDGRYVDCLSMARLHPNPPAWTADTETRTDPERTSA
ncbi:MAG TPA: GNAT family N-acetyltransferase [Aquabacterium sp.]|nr:GNAT family N-acetyltransferase [Aquabacterium sp.]HQC97522.1 GNAT family N-acetyltransferase [Aquabacterium sp.]